MEPFRTVGRAVFQHSNRRALSSLWTRRSLPHTTVLIRPRRDYHRRSCHQHLLRRSHHPSSRIKSSGQPGIGNGIDIQGEVRQHSTTSININRTKNDAPENDETDTNNIRGTIPSHGRGVQIGQYATLHRTFRQNDVNTFGTLIGDFNPVHFPRNETSQEEPNHGDKPIVHGILLSSLFSTIFGTLIPGCIYRSQSLKFQQPVYVDEQICGRVVVKKLRQINRQGGNKGVLCTCDTTVTKTANRPDEESESDEDADDDIVCISGEAQVWLPGATVLESTKSII